ncbi:MAG: glycogen/starch synthase, partial [Leptospirales bacterium]|nr:glycogen/starch synthase [Leptospirales bacterium]
CRFINTYIGKKNRISFQKPDAGKYFLRLYRNPVQNAIATENNISFEDIELLHEDETLSCEYTFNEYGHYDFILMTHGKEKSEWIDESEYSGRINVIPDIRGEIVLEIFVDIHGHTKAYWLTGDGHPGLLYNENGEIIRLGNLNDVSAHLEHIKNTYFITSIYLLGTQKRGNNREDWAPEATSPSPFSPMSLIDIEPALGGEQALKKLTAKAHSLGMKVIVDIVPHVNRKSLHISDALAVMTYDDSGNLVYRSSTDGRYGSWNDGKLLNYRKFEVWEWLLWSIDKLIDDFDIDGVRFDSAHAIPIMMKKNNFPFVYGKKRSHEEMVEGGIIVNEREYDHFMTTGYYDCTCRDQIAVPIHYYIMLGIERKLREKKKSFFVNIAECFWGHEQFLTRSGLIPYNSSLFKICEAIMHGKTDVREIYHVYDNYFPTTLPEGTELLGILGNHDERRALNTFGERGLRAAIGLTFFMHGIVLDYEGSAEGESWKVFLDNIYVNWNQFESAATRSLFTFYRDWYKFHSRYKGKSYLLWADNNMVAAAIKFTDNAAWVGAFNFDDSNQNVSIQFDNANLPIRDDAYYKLSDIVYSGHTKKWSYFTGKELKVSYLRTVVSYTERIKLFKLEETNLEEDYSAFLIDSFLRLADLSKTETISSNFAFSEIAVNLKTFKDTQAFFAKHVKPLLSGDSGKMVLHALKRALFYLFKLDILKKETLYDYMEETSRSASDEFGKSLILELSSHHTKGPIVFMSAEANPFSKSGGLANVVYELPSEMAKLNEEVYVITGYYRHGSEKEKQMMADSVKEYNIQYTGVNVSFLIMGERFEVGVHSCKVNGITYFLLDHHAFF